MKKFKLLIMVFGVITLFFGVSESRSQGINYEVEYPISATSNGIYLVTTCNSNSGSACNMPGSIHRSDISAVLAAIR
jgi:hypothetical protein